MRHPRHEELIEEARRLAYGARTVADCEAAGKRMTAIIKELGDDRRSVFEIEAGYGEMLAKTWDALEAMEGDDA